MESGSNRFIQFLKNPSFIFAGLLGILLIILRQIEYAFMFHQGEPGLILGGLALIFLCVGILLYHYLRPAENKEIEVIIINENTNQSSSGKMYSGPELSEREKEILVLIANGQTNQEISDTLFISIPTVKTHISNLYQKLDVNNRTKAILKAREYSLID